MLSQHCLQYAIIDGIQFPHSPLVYGTEGMHDHEILRYLRDHSDGLTKDCVYKLTHSDLKSGSPIPGAVIRRFDRCWVCNETSPCHVLEGYRRA